MEYEWDKDKRRRNVTKHKIDFTAIGAFDWAGAIIWLDLRGQYGEMRFRAQGRIGDRLHIVIFTARGARARLISLRKANNKEVDWYEKASRA